MAVLVLALAMASRGQTRSATIPFSDLGARATADYKGDALNITPTSDGALLCCGLQKLEGRATAEGLWLESTDPGAAGKLHLVATAIRREANSAFSPQPSFPPPALIPSLASWCGLHVPVSPRNTR